LEFFAGKNDASLFVTGLHSKKRPHDLVFTRIFDGRVLDMIELGIDDIKEMSSYKVRPSYIPTSQATILTSSSRTKHLSALDH
jgi:ribosome production factor 2